MTSSALSKTPTAVEKKVIELLSSQSNEFFNYLSDHHVCLTVKREEEDLNEEHFRGKFTSQIYYDASDMHLERSFHAYDKDGDSTLDAEELCSGLLTGAGFDFLHYPPVFVKLLGVLCNKALGDAKVKELCEDKDKRNTFLKGWKITYVVYREVVRLLKFHVLFHPEIVQRMFKKTRFTRLMAQSPAIRYLRKLEMKKHTEVEGSVKLLTMLSKGYDRENSSDMFGQQDLDNLDDEDFWKDVGGGEVRLDRTAGAT